MNVLKITIVRVGSGPDTLYLHTDLPDGLYPFNEEAVPQLKVARGNGEFYVSNHFPGVPFEILG